MKKVSYFLSIALATTMLVACGGQKKEKAAEEVTEVKERPEMVYQMAETSVPAEGTAPAYTIIETTQVDLSYFPTDASGVITIFDGSSFYGWRGYNKTNVPSRWVIEDKALKFNGSGGGEAQEGDGGDIIFAHKFKNFELTFEWKVAEGSNSGVFVLAQEIKNEPIYISSPEYQILDNINHADASQGKDGNRKSASLYDMIPAVPQNAKPIGEWNTASIMVYKGSVFHKQNGETVVEYHLWTPQWTEMLQASKFSEDKWPLAFHLLNNLGGTEREGYIGFQDHGDDVWFRNIKVKIMK